MFYLLIYLKLFSIGIKLNLSLVDCHVYSETFLGFVLILQITNGKKWVAKTNNQVRERCCQMKWEREARDSVRNKEQGIGVRQSWRGRLGIGTQKGN